MRDNPNPPSPLRAEAAPFKVDHYFNEGRCSGHDQFNGRYCRDAAGPEQWCIHCAGFMLLKALAESSRLPAAPAHAICSFTDTHPAGCNCGAAPDTCPSYICPTCYHEKDACSHCDKPASRLPAAPAPSADDFDKLIKAIWNTAGGFNPDNCNAIRDLIHRFNASRTGPTTAPSVDAPWTREDVEELVKTLVDQRDVAFIDASQERTILAMLRYLAQALPATVPAPAPAREPPDWIPSCVYCGTTNPREHKPDCQMLKFRPAREQE